MKTNGMKARGMFSLQWPAKAVRRSSALEAPAMDYPVYLLRRGKQWHVVFPENRSDIGHTDFWEQTVSHIVAEHFKIPQQKLCNLPYCERRGRIVDNTIYYGGRAGPEHVEATQR